MKLIASKCECGAITVQSESNADNYNVSMSKADFKTNFPGLKITEHFIACNYCVNHWGVDLCGCGSGEKVGKCTNDFDECRNNTPSQYIDKQVKRELWR